MPKIYQGTKFEMFVTWGPYTGKTWSCISNDTPMPMDFVLCTQLDDEIDKASFQDGVLMEVSLRMSRNAITSKRQMAAISWMVKVMRTMFLGI
jgi:hypothetical protein